MLRWQMSSEFFDSDSLWIFELDSTLTKLQRTIQFDSDQLGEALDAFDELGGA